MTALAQSINNMVPHCRLTGYPRVFDGTGWGTNLVAAGSQDSQYIAANRDDFARRYKLLFQDERLTHCLGDMANFAGSNLSVEAARGIQRFLRPREVYQTADGKVVLLVSPDGIDRVPHLLLPLDFVRVTPLHSMAAASFVAIFDSEQEFCERIMHLKAFINLPRMIAYRQSEVPLLRALGSICHSGKHYLQKFRGEWFAVKGSIAEGLLRDEFSLNRGQARYLMSWMRKCPLPVAVR